MKIPKIPFTVVTSNNLRASIILHQTILQTSKKGTHWVDALCQITEMQNSLHSNLLQVNLFFSHMASNEYKLLLCKTSLFSFSIICIFKTDAIIAILRSVICMLLLVDLCIVGRFSLSFRLVYYRQARRPSLKGLEVLLQRLQNLSSLCVCYLDLCILGCKKLHSAQSAKYVMLLVFMV